MSELDIKNTFAFIVHEITGGNLVDEKWPHFEWNVKIFYEGRKLSAVYKTGIAHCVVKEYFGSPATKFNSFKHGFHGGKFILLKNRNPSIVKPNVPTLSDILSSLMCDAQAGTKTFSDFCSNFGYNEDSRKALETYLECQKIDDNLRRVFGQKKLSETQEPCTYENQAKI